MVLPKAKGDDKAKAHGQATIRTDVKANTALDVSFSNQ